MIHSFDTDIAGLVGVNAAIIYESIRWWCLKHKVDGTNYYDGNWWVFNSRRAWCELFPYLSEQNIKTALSKLVNAGLVIKGNYNNGKFDRTNWYAVADVSRLVSSNQSLVSSNQSIGENQPTNTITSTNCNINNNSKCACAREILPDGQWAETMLMHHQGLSADDIEPLVSWCCDHLVMSGNLNPSRSDVMRYARSHVGDYLEDKRVSLLKSRDIQERKMAFWHATQEYADEFDKDLRDSFVLYYTQPSVSDAELLRFEEHASFDVQATLKLWKQRDGQREKHTAV